jgi:hypothetical protein
MLMTTNQTLDHLAARLLGHVGEVLGRVRPTRVIVQGHSDSHGRRIGVVLSSHSGLRRRGGPAEWGHPCAVVLWLKRIHGELAWDHEATKLSSAYEPVFNLRCSPSRQRRTAVLELSQHDSLI